LDIRLPNKAIDTDLAGNGPGLWLRMQQAYDLWHVEQRLKDELARIEPAESINSPA